MADRIKGITVEIGGDTTGLSKALSGVNKEIKSTQSQLKDVEKLLKLDPGNTELLRQKYELLNQEVEQTDQKLDALKEAEKQVQAQFQRGDIGKDKYDALKREIIETEAKLGNLRTEAKNAENALNGIDEKPVEDVEQAAKGAEDALDDAGKEASNFGDYLKSGAIIEGVKGISDAIFDLADSVRDYRKVMGSLETSSENAGYSAEETEDAYKKLYGVLADNQSAATTVANLQAIRLEQDDLLDLMDLTIGAWAKYGDSIPIDGLAESINETTKAGQVTGTFADVLNWGSKEGETFGVKLKENTEANKEWNDAVKDATTAEDFFNLALQNAGTEAERADLIMQAMADQGLAQMAQGWRDNNQGLIDSNEAQAEFEENMAELAEKLEPVTNSIRDGFNRILDKVLELMDGVDFNQLAENISGAFDWIIERIDDLVGWWNSLDGNTKNTITTLLTIIPTALLVIQAIDGIGNAASLLMGHPALAIIAFWALIALKGDEIQGVLQNLDDFLQNVFAKDWSETFGALGEPLNFLSSFVGDIWNSIKSKCDGIIDFVRGIFTGDWERVWNGVMEIFGGIIGRMAAIAKVPINGVISLLNGLIDAFNWVVTKINSISIDIPSWVPFVGGNSWSPGLPTISKIPYLAKGGILSEGSAIVGEAGPELLTMMGNQAVVRPLTNQTSNTANFGSINVYINGSGQSARELAEEIAVEIENAVQRRGSVFA